MLKEEFEKDLKDAYAGATVWVLGKLRLKNGKFVNQASVKYWKEKVAKAWRNRLKKSHRERRRKRQASFIRRNIGGKRCKRQKL